MSDDDDDCIFIEETTIVNTSREKVESASFSLVEAVNQRSRSNAIQNQLDEEMDELDRMIRLQKSSTVVLEEEVEEIEQEEVVTVTKKRKILSNDDQKKAAKRAREMEKEKKAVEKYQKRSEAVRKREEKEKEKEMRKIEREISAAVNSKCELYTFSHVGKHVLQTLPGLEAEIRMLYRERKIENQLIIEEDLGTRIEWRRKCVELRENDDGRAERFEYSSTQDLFAVVVPSTTLKDVIYSNTLADFIIEQRAGFRNGRCTMLLVSFGKLEVQKKKLHNLAIEIYENHRAQIVQVENNSELALLTAQYLRSLARREKKRLEGGEGGGHRVQYLGEKGISIGSRTELVTDWWSKMLATIDRLSDAQRRAVLQLIPDPIAAIDRYSKMDYSAAVKEISELMTENGRRVGPAMAHRIVTMLTDQSGNAVVD